MSLAATTGYLGPELHVTGTETDLAIFGVVNTSITVDIYGSTLDVNDLSPLGAYNVDVNGLASPSGDPNHVIIEAPGQGAPDGLLLESGLTILDTPTQTDYTIVGLATQDDVRIKLNGGGTTTVDNLDALGAETIELDGTHRASAQAPGANAITFVGPYLGPILKDSSGYLTNPPPPLNLVLTTDPAGDPELQSLGSPPIVIQGSLPNDQTTITVPFQLTRIDQAFTDSTVTLDSLALQGHLEIDIVPPPFSISYNAYIFTSTNVAVSAVGPHLNVTVNGLDVLDNKYPINPSAMSGFGLTSLIFGAGLLGNIQGNVTVHRVRLTVDDSLSTAHDILTLSSQTLTGWTVPLGITEPTLTFDPVLYDDSIPSSEFPGSSTQPDFLITAGTGDSFDVEGTPTLRNVTNFEKSFGGALAIVNRATSTPPASVYVMGSNINNDFGNVGTQFYVIGDFSLVMGRRLNPDGTVTDVGQIAAIQNVFTYDYTGKGGVGSFIFDDSNATIQLSPNLDEYSSPIGAIYQAGYNTLVVQVPYYNFTAGLILHYIDANVDFSYYAPRFVPDGGNPDTFSVYQTGVDPFHFFAPPSTGGIVPPERLFVYNASAAVSLQGNGATAVDLIAGGANGSDLYDNILGNVSVDDVSLDVDEGAQSIKFPALKGVFLTGDSLIGMIRGTISYTNLTAFTVEFPASGASATVLDTPVGITTVLSLNNTSLTILGTTGPIATVGVRTPEGGKTTDSVTVGDGTLTGIHGLVALYDYTLGNSLVAKVDDHADVPHPNVRFDLPAPGAYGYSAITGMSPAIIEFYQGKSFEIDGSAGSTYTDITSFPNTSLYAGKGSTVTVIPIYNNVTGLNVIGAAQVTIDNFGPDSLGLIRVFSDPSRPNDLTALTIDATYDPEAELVIGDDPSGLNSANFNAGQDQILYQGTTTSLTTLCLTQFYSSMILVNDTGKAGTTIVPGRIPVIVTGTTGPLVIDETQGIAVTLGIGSVQGLHGEINVLEPVAGSSPASLVIDDSADPKGQTVLVAPIAGGIYAITGLAPAPIQYNATAFALTLEGGLGGNTYTVLDTSAAAPILLALGGGSDAIEILVSHLGGFAPLTIDGGAGFNSLAMGGSGDLPLVSNDPNTSLTGSGSISANYPPSGPSDSVNYAKIATIVGATSTSLVSSSSQGTSTFGQSVTFTATVTSASLDGLVPTGSITFTDRATGALLGSIPIVNGSATLTISSLSAGSHTIVATYLPSSGFFESSASSTQNVVAGATYVSAFMSISHNGGSLDHRINRWVQSYTVTNTSSTAFVGPLALELTNLPAGVAFLGALINGVFVAAKQDPVTGAYFIDYLNAGSIFDAGQSVTFSLEFSSYPGAYKAHVFENLS